MVGATFLSFVFLMTINRDDSRFPDGVTRFEDIEVLEPAAKLGHDVLELIFE